MLVFPNAKINLGLYITEKRSDGYHNLESIFYPVQLKDSLEILKADNSTLQVYGQQWEGNTQDNIVWKAYRLLQQSYKNRVNGVEIHLLKSIPSGAGLGGGSADASFALKALNQLFELNLTEEKLLQLSLLLGSDCPFFIKNRPCLVKGRGEFLEEINLNLNHYQIVLVHHPIHVSTEDAFQDVVRNAPKINWNILHETPVGNWRNYLENAFEKTIFKVHPILKKLKEGIYKAGADYASMSGSGSVLYGLFRKPSGRSLQQLDDFKNHVQQMIRQEMDDHDLKGETKILMA